MTVEGGPCDALLTRCDRGVDRADEALHRPQHVGEVRAVEAVGAGELEAAQCARLVLERAVQPAELDQQARVARMLGIDQAQRRVGEMVLADLDQDVDDFQDLPGRRMQGALCGLVGVVGGFPGQSRRVAGLRQHGVGQRPVGRLPDQLRAQCFGIAEAPLLEMGDGLLPQGGEVGFLHDGYRVVGGAGHVHGMGAEPGRPSSRCRSRARARTASGPPDRGDSPPRGGEFRTSV